MGDVTWTLEGSPYLLTQDVYVSKGQSLTIDAGVIVDADPKTLNEPNINIDGGYLVIAGRPDAHVSIHERIGNINITGVSSTIAYADIQGAMVYALKGSVSISTSTIAGNSGSGLLLWDGIADIRASSIRDNAYGITIFADFDGQHSLLTIDHSLIVNSNGYAISNKGNYPVIARDNWWGSVDGPNASMFYGAVTYKPWLTAKPITESVSACCSSILFISGLEASSLYRTDSSLLGAHTNTLWAPNRNDDVRKLFLNTDGKSVDPSIFSGGPIGSVFGIYSVYIKFMSFLDGLARAGTINEWHGFGYDWRKPIVEVVNGAEQKATTTESLIKLVEDISSRSQTGKVTLVAHSNGGLVSKYLVKTLAEKGEASLIDSVISVAVPYLGTPQAITALLYGDTEEIAKGYILKASVAQELGRNMPSAYSLLPSAQYLSMLPGTIIGSSSVGYPNQSLMASAAALHNILDTFPWPSTIKRWAIVGWNAMTAQVISFTDRGHKNILSNMGDGTVIAQSAAYDAGTTTSVDVKASGAKNIAHANILESPSTEKIVDAVIKNNDVSSMSSDAKIESIIRTIPGVTLGEPDYSKEQFPLELSTHSPVELHVYDQNGNHVGVIPKPAGIPADVEDDLYTFYDADIPGSSFDISDESDSGRDTSVMIPDDGSGPYTVVIKGAGVGPFNFDISRLGSKGTIEKVSYIDLPTTPLMNATMTLDIAPLGSSASSSLIFNAPDLVVDIDGDGAGDMNVKANAVTDPVAFLESMKKVVQSLSSSIANSKGKDVFAATLRKIDQLENLARTGKISRLHDTARRFSSYLSHRIIKGMTDADRMTIVNMINEFLSHLASS